MNPDYALTNYMLILGGLMILGLILAFTAKYLAWKAKWQGIGYHVTRGHLKAKRNQWR